MEVLSPLLPMMSEHLCEVATSQVEQLVGPATNQIPWDAEQEDSRAKLNPSPFVQALLHFFQSNLFVHLQLLEPERCKLNPSEIEEERKYLETVILSHTGTCLVRLLDGPAKLTKVAIGALERDVQAIIGELKGGMCKLRALKIQQCFAQVLQVCRLLLQPDEMAKAVEEHYRSSVYPNLETSLLMPVLQKYFDGLPGNVFGKTEDQRVVIELLKALQEASIAS